MTTDPTPSMNRNTTGQRALRSGAALVVVVLLLGGLFLLVDFGEEQPDFHQPAHDALSEAATILSETFDEEKELVKQLQAVHGRLDKAIALLGQAEQLDPADRREFETLQVRLRALEDPNRMLTTNPKTLQRSYHTLTQQLNALAKKLAQPGS